jgi:hypothetical protein
MEALMLSLLEDEEHTLLWYTGFICLNWTYENSGYKTVHVVS